MCVHGESESTNVNYLVMSRQIILQLYLSYCQAIFCVFIHNFMTFWKSLFDNLGRNNYIDMQNH